MHLKRHIPYLMLIISIFLPAHVASAASIPKEEELPTFTHPPSVIKELNEVMDRFYRQVEVDTIIEDHNQQLADESEKINSDVDALNARIDAFNATREELNKELAALNKMKQKSKKFQKKLEAYNAKVEAHNKESEAIGKAQKAFERERRRTERSNKTSSRYVSNAIKAYNKWYRERKDVAFNKRLSQLYARLVREDLGYDKVKEKSKYTKKYLEQVRQIRQDLVDWRLRTNDEREFRMLYVEATLNGQENCNYMLDTGASSVTLSYPMVYTLGLENELGEEVIVSLAGGQRLTGRRLIIPEITVQGKTAKNVEAVAFADEDPGVTGLLGHSFLGRFDFVIDSSKEQPLSLKDKPKEKTGEKTSSQTKNQSPDKKKKRKSKQSKQ